jgi:hypothetical protein
MIDKLKASKEATDQQIEAHEALIGEAWKAGGGIREVAEHVGMTHTGVSKLLERRGIRERLKYEDDERARRELRGER